MGDITLPVPGVTPGPEWASALNQAISEVNDTASNAVPNTPEGRQALAESPELSATIVQRAVTDAVGQSDAPQLGEITFTRLNGGAPIFSVAAQNPVGGASTAPSIYWPYVVDARAALGVAAMDEFYMYYSTDHEPTHANSGVWLATGPSEIGPWVSRGRVYRDDAGGLQTETPTVVWNAAEGKFFMYYQQAASPGGYGDQQTLLATSTDGVAWTRVGIVMQASAKFPGDGHTGYFRVFFIGGQWIAYHLMGGGNYPYFGLSYSSDGRVWWTDPRPLSYSLDQLADGRRVEWNTVDLVWWRGRMHITFNASNFTSGAAAKDCRLASAILADDLRHIVGAPRYHLYPTSGTETTNYRSQRAYVGRDGLLYLIYQCDLDAGRFYAAVAGRGTV